MIRIFPEQADDLLDVGALPPTDKTELNYRTRPLSAVQEQRLTWLILLFPLPIVLTLSVLFTSAESVFPFLERLIYCGGILLIVWLPIRSLIGLTMRRDLIAGFLFSVGATGAEIWRWMDHADVWGWRLGLIVAWVACCLIARQAAAWILVGPTVDCETMALWEVNLPHVFCRGLSLNCPELLMYTLGLALVGPAWLLSAWMATEILGGLWYWPVCFFVSVPIIWSGWHVLTFALLPWPNLPRSLAATWRAITIFVTYDLYHTPAAGVFRFPTRWLRVPVVRWTFLTFVQVTVAFSYATCCPDPIEVYRDGGSFVGQTVVNFVLITISGPLVLVSMLWLVAGTLLDRFERELSHHRDPDTSDWDNYTDRIRASKDELEREHVLAGFSEKGDYPILIHDTIHQMHGHVLGDTGASKTSLAIAPQVTQMIARGDSTVVVIDLKGDRALFETCAREAARTKRLRFRWLSNEAGRSTFGFNPFLQSHNRLLTVEQLTQELLQGLSLDHGIEYGAGYFTAMNEIVLRNVLDAHHAQSFRELSDKLADRDWYGSIGGHGEDWMKARHLSALVKRLAASEAINVVPGMYPDHPEVHQESIDVTNLYEQPQVVYLNLRSAVEPTNAPAIARLFLWTMFTAASHQPQDGRRVYFFIDETQQIISDGIKLIFEQFRDIGGTIIAAHQTAGQLNRQGTDLSDTIDSCTAVKQVFRASDLRSLQRLEHLSGTKRERSAMWMQPYERGTGELVDRFDPVLAEEGAVRVTERESPCLTTDALLALGARRQSSLIRFTFGSGYTQFAGRSVPMVSPYSISFSEYQRRRSCPWPEAPGAFTILGPGARALNVSTGNNTGAGSLASVETDAQFASEFERRGRPRSAQSVNL